MLIPLKPINIDIYFALKYSTLSFKHINIFFINLILLISSFIIVFPYILGSQPLWFACRFCSKENTTEQQKEERYEDDIKSKILEASLPFVPEMGWSKEAISKGAQQIGYPGITHGLFPKGGADLVHHFQTSSNVKFIDILKQVINYIILTIVGKIIITIN